MARTGELPVQLCNYMDVYHNDVISPWPTLLRATATNREVEKYRLEPGDVVITKDSEDPTDIAVPAYVRESADDLVCGYHLAIIRPGPMVRGRYLKYWFDLPRTRAYFGSRANGATRFGLTIGTIGRCVVGLPELSEQDRAVEALSEWDRVIELAEQRLERARDRKRGLMQALLTGETRFPEFEGQPWRQVRLGEMGMCIRGVTYKPADLRETHDDETVLLYRATNIQDDTILDEATLILPRTIVSDDRLLRVGDRAVCMSNGSRALVGKSAPILDASDARTVGAFCAIFRPTGLQRRIRFVHHLFQSDSYRRQVHRALGGSSINNLTGRDVESMRFAVPRSAREMCRIAAVLDTADNEIALQRDLITHLRAQKRSLLEQLLTGKLRLPPRLDNGRDADADPVPTPTPPPP